MFKKENVQQQCSSVETVNFPASHAIFTAVDAFLSVNELLWSWVQRHVFFENIPPFSRGFDTHTHKAMK